MTRIDIARKITKLVVAASVGYTARNVIENNTTHEDPLHMAEAFVGGAVIGGMAAEATGPYIDRKFNDLRDMWDAFKSKP